jgi:hypothetical protein
VVDRMRGANPVHGAAGGGGEPLHKQGANAWALRLKALFEEVPSSLIVLQ